jgi:hypothetical protein
MFLVVPLVAIVAAVWRPVLEAIAGQPLRHDGNA